MIGRLRGMLADRSLTDVLVDVGGVGYEVAMSPRDLTSLPPVGEEIVLHTHLHVREDAQALYGFMDDRARNLFRALLGASGVGPKLALAMLSTLDSEGVHQAVMTDDVAALTAVPGIGNRTAQKLIIELRARLELPDGELPGAESPLHDVREALEGLGYSSTEIQRAVDGLDGGEVDELLRAALQRLGAE